MRIVILGSGNVASQLVVVFNQHTKVELVQWYFRDKKKEVKSYRNINIIHELDDLEAADIYLFALSDEAISSVSSHFQNGELVVHMAGGIALEALQNNGAKGVWYPVQSFTSKKTVSMEGLPFAIEGSDQIVVKTLKTLTTLISGKPIEMDSTQRVALHLAAVICNNFTNHLYSQAAALCKSHQIDFKILQPLIDETTARLQTGQPKIYQTGPARRGDQKTIEKHLSITEPPLTELYTLLTKTIKKQYGKEKL
mgnify:FL=1